MEYFHLLKDSFHLTVPNETLSLGLDGLTCLTDLLSGDLTGLGGLKCLTGLKWS